MATTHRSVSFLIHLSLVQNNYVVTIRNMKIIFRHILIWAIILKTSIKALKRVNFLHAQTISSERLDWIHVVSNGLK